MDSFELNKIAAAILIALLTIKGADLISHALIHPKMLTENAFKIEGAAPSATAGTSAEKAGPAPLEPLLAKANAQNGANIFKKCTSCHTAEKGGPNKIGPDLYGVVGAEKGKHPGYTYSAAMEKKGGTWTYADLNHFIYNPREFIPGTKMSFAGLKNDQERADVIAYLRQQSDHPLPLPEVKPEAKPEAGKPPAAPAAKPEAGKPPAAPEAKPEAGKAPAAKPEAGKAPAAPEAKPEAGKPPAAPEAKPEAGKPPAAKPEAGKAPAAPEAKPEAPKPPAEVPLTRPLGDLSHKGRGILTTYPFFFFLLNKTVRKYSMDTSPLVGEVAQRAGEGSFFSDFHLKSLKSI